MSKFIEDFYYGNIEPQESCSELKTELKRKLSILTQTEEQLTSKLTEEEKAVALRARNHKTHAVKSSSQIEYKKATAFEAVVGYLYLTKQNERLEWLLKKSTEENL